MIGFITDTIQQYELKQSEIATAEGEQRWAGRVIDGQVVPDIQLNDGRYFIPYDSGTETITKEQIFIPEMF